MWRTLFRPTKKKNTAPIRYSKIIVNIEIKSAADPYLAKIGTIRDITLFVVEIGFTELQALLCEFCPPDSFSALSVGLHI